MALPFDGQEVAARLRPAAVAYPFDLERTLEAVVALESRIPEDAFSAQSLGVQRLGNGAVISANGLVVTIGYLITEAQDVVLTLNDGRRVPAHPLGSDPVTGFGLVQALEPLDIDPLPLGDSKTLREESPVIIAGGGGRAHAAAGQVLARMPFAGYWEYFLDSAILTEPAHPHWGGAALIGEAGQLVGVGSLSMQRRTEAGRVVGLNMFVPSELLAPILDDLARGRQPHPPRPWLGVLAQDDGEHVVVIGVSPRGPAARAELAAGDIILAVNGEAVTELAEFYPKLWASGPAGATINLRIAREGDVFDVAIRSADRTALLKKPRLN